MDKQKKNKKNTEFKLFKKNILLDLVVIKLSQIILTSWLFVKISFYIYILYFDFSIVSTKYEYWIQIYFKNVIDYINQI